ncbi:YybH family protein [Flagellimonas baculiformis]|uniref:YybH family protein n=1 Tax=Flagellimonas baculiformis TaxID=3067310 RepID=UPI00296FFB46|nr:nuclear transport factor 2 family protein [Muricauda sp. D6]
MKRITLQIFLLAILITGACFGQTNPTMENQNQDRATVLRIMESYKEALENLTTEGTLELFAEDSEVFESGGVEGTYQYYLDHHIGPELGHFNSFRFSDYTIEVKVELPFAFTTESYVYTIGLKSENGGEGKTISRKGVATSILKKTDGEWKIVKMHNSSRNNGKN